MVHKFGILRFSSKDGVTINGLNFFTPIHSPHGFCGVFQVIFGTILLYDAFTGNFDLYTTDSNQFPSIKSLILTSFWLCSIGMCIGALNIVNKAPMVLRPIFKYTAFIELILIYFSFRFSNLYIDLRSIYFDIFDKLFSVLYLCLVCYLMHYSLFKLNYFNNDQHSTVNRVVRIVGLCLYATLHSITGYLVAFVYYGSVEYVTCLLDAWPMQLIGFDCYVFNSIILILSIAMFIATLITRKIIKSKITALLMLTVPVFGILILAVLVQEIFIPGVSTQRLIIFCPRPEPLSRLDYIESYFNLSDLAQNALKMYDTNMDFSHNGTMAAIGSIDELGSDGCGTYDACSDVVGMDAFENNGSGLMHAHGSLDVCMRSHKIWQFMYGIDLDEFKFMHE